MDFVLRFPKQDIEQWANCYDYGDITALEIGKRVQSRGYFIKSEFIDIAEWKSPRRTALCKQNKDSFVEEVTRIALNTSEERLRIEVLTLLDGVGWPTASVILHFGHSEAYPILDFRALWSLSINTSEVQYNFELWQAYTNFCRDLATDAAVSIRTLDQALWQYSKVHQISSPTA